METVITSASMHIRVAIFEDGKLVRDAFSAIISGTNGFLTTGAFSNGNNLMHDIERSTPDVVLMDIEMPGRDGIEATKMISEKYPDIKILIQTVFEDEEKIFAALCAGASGYVLKSTPPSRLLEYITEVYNGGAPMSPAIAGKVLRLFQRVAPQATKSDTELLSKREKEILLLMMQGLTFKQIGEQHFIAFETVRTHVKKIYKKLHVASSTEAVAKAIRQGLI
jgi:DNA-binding NarL/FixJ family response regulator